MYYSWSICTRNSNVLMTYCCTCSHFLYYYYRLLINHIAHTLYALKKNCSESQTNFSKIYFFKFKYGIIEEIEHVNFLESILWTTKSNSKVVSNKMSYYFILFCFIFVCKSTHTHYAQTHFINDYYFGIFQNI